MQLQPHWVVEGRHPPPARPRICCKRSSPLIKLRFPNPVKSCKHLQSQ